MSIRAYIVREKRIYVDEEKHTYYDEYKKGLTTYVNEDLEYAINIWHQDKLIELMLDYGAEDYTNNDFVGEIEMGKEDFDSMLENERKLWSKEDWESLGIVQKYFDEGNDWLILKCY